MELLSQLDSNEIQTWRALTENLLLPIDSFTVEDDFSVIDLDEDYDHQIGDSENLRMMTATNKMELHIVYQYIPLGNLEDLLQYYFRDEEKTSRTLTAAAQAVAAGHELSTEVCNYFGQQHLYNMSLDIGAELCDLAINLASFLLGRDLDEDSRLPDR